MEERRLRRRIRLPRQSQVFFYLLLALMLFLTWILFRPFIIFMIAGVFVAVLSMPLDRMWERAIGKHRARTPRSAKRRDRLAAAATIVTLFLIITAPLLALGFALLSDARAAAEAVQRGAFEDRVDAAVDRFVPGLSPEERANWTGRIVAEIEAWVAVALQRVVAGLIGFVADLFIAVTVILFVVYYILTDGHRLIRYIRRTAPLPNSQIDYLLAEAKRGLDAVFVGQILTSVIQGGLGGVGFLIAGLPGAVLWAIVMMILSLLPVVGAFLVWIPAAAFLLLSGQIWQGVFLAAWGVLVVSQVDNFIRPKLIGSRAQIHPIFVLVGVLGGVAAFGFIGLFLGPLLVGVTISILRVWESDYLDAELAGEPGKRAPGPHIEVEEEAGVPPAERTPAADEPMSGAPTAAETRPETSPP